MSISYKYNGSPITLKVAPSGLSLTERAEDGEAAFGSIPVDDELAAIAVVGHKLFTVEESACTTQPRLFTGIITMRNMGRSEDRGMLAGDDPRLVDVQVADLNALLNLRQITGTDGKRPQEKWWERLDWLAASDYVAPIIPGTDYLHVDLTENDSYMDAADYTGSYPADVLSDIAHRLYDNVLWFVFWDTAASEVSLFFDRESSALGTSTLSISNDMADVDADTVFAPSMDSELVRSPETVYSDVIVEYTGGRVFRHRQSTEDAYTRRGTTISRPFAKSATTASELGEAFLDLHDSEEDRITTAIIVPSSKAGLVRAGQRIESKFTHLPGYEDFVSLRVAECSARPITDVGDLYELRLELVAPRPGVGPAALCDGSVNALAGITATKGATNLPPDTFNPDGDDIANPDAATDGVLQAGQNDTAHYVETVWSGWHTRIREFEFTLPAESTVRKVTVRADLNGSGLEGWEDGLYVKVGGTNYDAATYATYDDADVWDWTTGHGQIATWDFGDDVATTSIVLGKTEYAQDLVVPFYLTEIAACLADVDDTATLSPVAGTPILSTSDPTVNDDANDGYVVGQTWVNTATGDTFILTDATPGAAVWTETSGAGGGIYLNVLDYGAAGDGATDDTAAIQDAIDAASAAGGGIVFFPTGHYIVKTDTSGQRYAMTVPSNVSLLGEGYASHIELTSAGNAATVQHVIELGTASTSASYISIRDLRVEGNYASLGPAKTIQGIAARQDSDQTKHVDHVLIEGCWVIDTNAAIVCSKDGGSSGSARTANRHLDWSVVGNYIHTTGNKAIELQECLGGRIIRNRAFAVEDGYQAINYSERILIADNYVEYDQAGISVTEGCIDVDVVDNVCYSTTASGSIGAAGIILRREPYTGAVTSYRIRIARNRVTCSHASGIPFAFETRTENTGTSRWEDCEIIDNVFKGTGDSYLYDKASATRSDATGLKILDNFFVGPALTSASWASSGTRVERNRFNTAHTANSDGWWYEGNKFISTLTVVGAITQGPMNIGPVVVSGAAAAGNVLTASSASAAAWAAPEAPAVASPELLVADGTTGPNGITPTSYVEEGDAHTTTSATLEDIPDVTTTITLQRTSHVAAWLNTQVSGSGVCVIGVAINIDGTDHDEMQHSIAGSDASNLAVTHRTATALAPGTYTVKGRMRRVSGASTPSVDRADLLVMAMGHSGPVMLTNEAEDDYLYSD